MNLLRRPVKATARILILIIAAALAMAGGACRRAAEPGTLVVAIELPPRGFDPRFSTTIIPSARVMQLIYDTLVTRSAEFEFVPSLAREVVESTDQKTFTFYLRPGVTFHDGRPLTSADVKYTFASILDPATQSLIRGGLEKIETIETPDPLTVIFRAREPFYTFMGNLPAIGIIPDGAGADNVEAPIGSGPYRFVSYSEGDMVRLAANESYWAGAPNIPRVNIVVITDNSTRQAALMSGEVDLAYNAQFDPETVRALGFRKDMQVVIGDGASIGYLGCNTTQTSLLSNIRVRQAVAYGIDRQVIISQLLRDQAREAHAIMPPEHWAYNHAITTYGHNPERAMRLLDEAGYPDPDGDGPQPRLELSILTSTTQLSRNIASIMQDQLRRIGIRLNLESLETQTLFSRLAQAQYDLYYLIGIGFNQSTDVFQFVYHSRYQNPEFNDAIAKLRAANNPPDMRPLFEKIEPILARRQYCPSKEVTEMAGRAASLDPARDAEEKKRLHLRIAELLTDRGGQNRMRYCNPQVDEWIIQADQAAERPAKKELYASVQKTVSDELPQIYTWYPANVLVARKRVGNIQIEASGSWLFITKLTLAEG